MSSPSLRLVRILSATIALGALAACGGGSTPTPPPPPPTSGPTDLSVAVTAPTTTIVPGQKAVWTVVVTNTGAWPSSSTTINNVVDTNSTVSDVHCKASPGASCPALLAASMTMGQIPAGGVLTFQVGVVVTAGTNGVVFESSTVTAPNDTNRDNNTQTVTADVRSYDVSVSNVAAGTTIGAGLPTTFTATVANAGPVDATNIVITSELSTPIKPAATTCVAAGGATCPDSLAFPISVPTLPVGGTLTLSINATVPSSFRGTATDTVSIKDDNDSALGNNVAVATTTVVDARSGTYQMYATNGQVYTMTVDFDALTWAVSGNGIDLGGALTTTDQLAYAISSNQNIHASSQDLLDGALDFGAGPVAYLAARAFSTTIDDIGTAPLTVFGLSTNHVGTSTTTIESQSFDATSATMSDCTSDTQIYRVAACPSSSLASYALTFSGADITGVDAVDNLTIHFRVAQSGTTRILLRAETDPSCNCQRFGVGIADNVSPLAGSFSGANSIGSSGGVKLTDTSYTASWVTAAGSSFNDTATLAVQGTSAPVGLRGGVRASDGSFIYVIENAPVALVVGSTTSAANGTMEIWVK